MDARAQLDGFIDKFTPDVAALARALFAGMVARIPGATVLVYDNYNALAIAFGSGDRVRDMVLSLAVMPRWVDLYFSRGVEFDDPHRLLEGTGNKGRHVKIRDAAMLADPRVDALIAQALALAEPPVDPAGPGALIIKSISAKQRPRRPVERS